MVYKGIPKSYTKLPERLLVHTAQHLAVGYYEQGVWDATAVQPGWEDFHRQISVYSISKLQTSRSLYIPLLADKQGAKQGESMHATPVACH